MKCAVMQPYLLPYLGYFQLIAAVDMFVVFDDVNFIKKGWIHRNNLLLNNKPHQFNLPIANASQNRYILDHFFLTEADNQKKLLSLIRHAYHKAPQFDTVYPLLENILMYPEPCVSKYLAHGLRQIAKYIGLSTAFTFSSSIAQDNHLKGSEKILAIAKTCGAKTYVNPIGGLSLYDRNTFTEKGLELFFIKMREGLSYPQFESESFVPNLSIVDVMMFNEPIKLCERLLSAYDLI